MAHEMGHYVLNHAFKLFLYSSILLLGAFVFSSLLFEGFVRRWGGRWRVRGIADPAALPLLSLLFTTYYFLLTPISNTATE
jgi:STE24 endopeptidase